MIQISQASQVANIVFDKDAESFTLLVLPEESLTISVSLVNNSNLTQSFVAVSDNTASGALTFTQDATITGLVNFTDQARPSDVAGGTTFATGSVAGATTTIHNLAGNVTKPFSGRTDFILPNSSAEDATIINDGATVSGAMGGVTSFGQGKARADRATLIAKSGTNGGGGGSIIFDDVSAGDQARVKVFGNGYMDLSGRNGRTLPVGSIERTGQIYLGDSKLIVGSNSLSTTFSGVLHAGGPAGGNGSGELWNLGLVGTLTLSGANLYTNGTTNAGRTLIVNNRTGSATGTGPVTIQTGTLGGSGIIAGSVTLGTNSGTGAFLAPAAGTNKPTTLTIQGALTFDVDAHYTYAFEVNGSQVRSDLVIANGVTIGAAVFIFNSSSESKLAPGTVLTVISNTSANPIGGFGFSNLQDGTIVNVNGNKLQANYEGGDGNDLTLTVVQ